MRCYLPLYEMTTIQRTPSRGIVWIDFPTFEGIKKFHYRHNVKKCTKYPFDSILKQCAEMVPDLRSPRNLAHPLWNDTTQTILRVNHGLTQLALVPPLIVLNSALSSPFRRKGQDKVPKTNVWGQIASDNGWLVVLSRPGRSGGEEPGLEAIGGREP